MRGISRPDLAVLRVSAFAFLALFSLLTRGSAQVHGDHDIAPRQSSSARSDQGPAATPSVLRQTGIFSVRVKLVLVPVSVTDGMNHPITGLTKENFSVFEDERQQSIQYFSEEDAPASIGILLDVSGTMSTKIAAAREALAEFFKASHPDDDYFVITFADRPELVVDYTQSSANIQGKLVTVKPYGYTALLDAVELGLRKLQNARHQRRVLLIISDGGDNSSRHKLRDMKNEVAESGVEVYAMGMFDDGLPVLKALDEQFGKHLLTQITEASGGQMIPVHNLADLPEIATAISVQMRNEYLLGYHPPSTSRDGSRHQIKVRVARLDASHNNAGRLHAAFKKGYTARQD